MKVLATKSTKVKKSLKAIVFLSMILSLILFYIVLSTKLNIPVVLALLVSFYFFITKTIILNKQIKKSENLITKKGKSLMINIAPKIDLEIAIANIQSIEGKRYGFKKNQDGFGYVVIRSRNVNYRVGIVDNYESVVSNVRNVVYK